MVTRNVVYPHSERLFLIRNEVLIHAATCMNLGNIVISERSQTQSMYCIFCLCEKPKPGKYTELTAGEWFLGHERRVERAASAQ